MGDNIGLSLGLLMNFFTAHSGVGGEGKWTEIGADDGG